MLLVLSACTSPRYLLAHGDCTIDWSEEQQGWTIDAGPEGCTVECVGECDE